MHAHLFYLFFFSSRRRHTRYWRDWSSDVCSSDLNVPLVNLVDVPGFGIGLDAEQRAIPARIMNHMTAVQLVTVPKIAVRSEERRVGKECRSRWSPYH